MRYSPNLPVEVYAINWNTRVLNQCLLQRLYNTWQLMTLWVVVER
jgi:hypothetical protein